MPLAQIYMIEGRTEEQKKAVIEKVTKALQEAVDAPRFHQQWLPELTNVENFALSPDTRKLLEAMGHKFGNPQPANHVAASPRPS